MIKDTYTFAATAILKRARTLPVLTIHKLESALPLADALASGGLKYIEITLRTPVALDAIELIARSRPEVTVGAGTVLHAEDLKRSINAGAQFALSPGATSELLNVARKSVIPFIPGIATPSELMQVAAFGFAAVKVFPAKRLGGPAYLRDLAAPIRDIVFCPTGGIAAQDVESYRALNEVVCIGGSWMAPSELIDRADWSAIAALAASCQ